MRVGDKVGFRGKVATIEALDLTPGMADISVEGEGFTRRCRKSELVGARSNPRSSRNARWNPEPEELLLWKDIPRYLRDHIFLPDWADPTMTAEERAMDWDTLDLHMRRMILADIQRRYVAPPEEPKQTAPKKHEVRVQYGGKSYTWAQVEAGFAGKEAQEEALARKADLEGWVPPEPEPEPEPEKPREERKKKTEAEEKAEREAEDRRLLLKSLVNRALQLENLLVGAGVEKASAQVFARDWHTQSLAILDMRDEGKYAQVRKEEDKLLKALRKALGDEAAFAFEGVGGAKLEKREDLRARERRDEGQADREREKAAKEKRQRSLKDSTWQTGAAFYSYPDPPRLSKDRMSFCGNPIDGTAYYLALQKDDRTLSYWLSAEKAIDLVSKYQTSVEEALRKAEESREIRGFKAVHAGDLERFAAVVKKEFSPAGKRSVWMPDRIAGSKPVLYGDGAAYYEEVGGKPDTFYYVFGNKGSYNIEQLKLFFDPYKTRAARTKPGEKEVSVRTVLMDKMGYTSEVAEALVRDSSVFIGGFRRGRLVADLNERLPEKTLVVVQFRDKSRSPFFSWVYEQGAPTKFPGLRERPTTEEWRQRFTCQDSTVGEERAELMKANNAIGNLLRQFGKIRFLIGEIVEEPGRALTTRAGDLFPEIYAEALGSAVARLENWYDRLVDLKQAKDPMADLVLSRPGALRVASYLPGLAGMAYRYKIIEKPKGERAKATNVPGQVLMGLILRENDPLWARMIQQMTQVRDLMDRGADPGKPTEEYRRAINFVPEKQKIFLKRAPDKGGRRRLRKEREPAQRLGQMIEEDLPEFGKVEDEQRVALEVWGSFMSLMTLGPRTMGNRWKTSWGENVGKRLAVLCWMYYTLGGYEFNGPLVGHSASLTDGQILVDSLGVDIKALAKGTGIGRAAGQVHIYKTYNPLLFQTARLYWAGSRQKSNWPGFGSQEALWRKIDRAGIYGEALTLVEHATMYSDNEEELEKNLRARVEKSLAALVEAKLNIRDYIKNLKQVRLNRSGKHALLNLLWPLGETSDSVNTLLTGLVKDPTLTLQDLKGDYSAAVVGAYELKSVGPVSSRLEAGSGSGVIRQIQKGERVVSPEVRRKTGGEMAAYNKLVAALAKALEGKKQKAGMAGKGIGYQPIHKGSPASQVSNAIRIYEREKNLPSTGVFGKAVVSALIADARAPYKVSGEGAIEYGTGYARGKVLEPSPFPEFASMRYVEDAQMRLKLQKAKVSSALDAVKGLLAKFR